MQIDLISFDLSSINIIIANDKDINEICGLNQDEYWDNIETVDEETQFKVGKWWIKNNLLRWHMRVLKACEGNILVAKIGTEIIGELDYVQSNEYDKGFFSRLHIIWLLVKKEYRTFGIAKKMIGVLKSKFPQNEIWVEPEDNRSLQLYQSIGIRRKSIDTWKLDSKQRFLENFSYDLIEKLKFLNYKQLINLIKENKVSCIVGRYYAPSFDIEQLNRGDEVKRYIWGNTDKSSILVCRLNNLTLYTVMTQYVRIYINQVKYDTDDLKLLLEYIFDKNISLGFDEIYIQVYHSKQLDSILKELGCQIMEDSYPIFNLQKLKFDH